MFATTRKVLIIVCLFPLTIPLYAQSGLDSNKEARPVLKPDSFLKETLTELPDSSTPEEKITNSFLDFINKKAYAATIDEKEEKRILRKKWEELLGIDIFYPYFKAKEVESWVRDKASVEFFKLRGRPKFDDDQIKYIFKVKF
jgi:hypothetical protein